MGAGLKAMKAMTLVAGLIAAFAAPAQAAFPGENGRIAISMFDIYTVDEAFRMPLRVVNSTSGATNPAWSPDGSKIAFAEAQAIHIVDAGGGNRVMVLDWGGLVGEIDWAPDGEQLVAALQTCDGDECRFDIYTMDLDGSGLVNLTPDTLNDRNPAWSPDGARIAFDRTSDGELDIYTITPAGDDLTNVTVSLPGVHFDPDWSPDGTRFVANAQVPDTRIVTMNADGTGIDDIAYGFSPVWSPDGTQLAFDQGDDIYTTEADGYDLRRLTYFNAASAPDWQPLQIGAGTGYPRPKGATPVRVSLVPAYDSCTAPNRTHGPPLAFGSCSPMNETSGRLTVGTPDANGQPVNARASVTLEAVPGAPSTPADEADVQIAVSALDVRCGHASVLPCVDGNDPVLSDYFGQLRLLLPVSVTDRFNGGGTDASATTFEGRVMAAVPCNPTNNDPTIGSECSTSTSANAVLPGTVREGQRAIWGLGQIELEDGGQDSSAFGQQLGPPDDGNRAFLRQGVFVP